MSGGNTISTSEVKLGGLKIQNTGYGVTIPLVYGTNRLSPTLIDYTNFIATQHTQTQGGKGGGISTSNYSYTASVVMALCEGPIAGFGQVWIDKDIFASPAFVYPGGTKPTAASEFLGTYPQTSWTWMQSYNDGVNGVGGRAMGYQGIAYVAYANYNLGNSATLGNHSFELVGVGTLQNGYDVNVLDVVSDFLNNANYGALFPYLGSITAAWNYCQANGIFISPVLAVQKPAQEWLTQFALLANLGLVWSGGTLKVIPYGDQSITGHGATYTPNVTPVYDLNDDDFQPVNNDPVTITRKRQADAFNSVTVECLNRSNQYNIETVEVRDQANVEAYGLRPMAVIQMHEICVPSVAKLVAQAILQRQLYIRNEYAFALSWKYCLLEPMDIVSLTDAALGLSLTPVRITAVEENYDGLLTMTAEEMPYGISQPAQYPHTGGAGYSPNFNAAPPNSNAPLIFTPPMELAANSLELWMAACGPAGWGGCNVWVSSDNATYRQVGTIIGSARMGVLSALLASGADPDLANTAHVDLTSSLGVMYSGTQADADLLHTLCHVDGEYISYQTATLTAANKYDLTYLRRGAYNSVVSAHALNAPFARLDDAIFKLPYTAEQIGTTLYVKLQAFNQYQAAPQDISTLTPASLVIPAPRLPPNVTGFLVRQNNTSVSFSWNDVADYALKGYDIGYAPQGTTNWAQFLPLTVASKGTEMTNAQVPPGTWVFGIRARDVINQLSPLMATQNLIVTNPNLNVIHDVEEVGWTGAAVGLVEHYTGVLVPLGTYPCSHYYAWEDFNQWVPDPVTFIQYTTPVVDAGYDEALRVYDTIALPLGVGQTGIPAMNTFIDTWLTAGSDLNAYVSWVIGVLTMRFIRGRISATIAQGNLFMVTDYTLAMDMSPVIESPPQDISITAPNSTVTNFPSPYNYPPYVLPVVKSGAGTSVTASSITKTGCIFHIWQGSTEVSGTLTYTATGE